jgi:hypothetical protein
MVILLFNTFVCLVDPNASCILTMDLISVLATVALLTLGASINIFGSSFGDSPRLIFLISLMSLVLFQITFNFSVFNFSIGLGLINTIVNVFPSNQMYGLGYILALTISFVTLSSGILMVMEDA